MTTDQIKLYSFARIFDKPLYVSFIAHFATDPAGAVHKTAIYLGTFIGGITFTGSLTAFGKLQGLLKSNALDLPGKNAYNISMGLASLGAMGVFMTSPDLGTGMAMLGKFLLLCGFISKSFMQGYN